MQQLFYFLRKYKYLLYFLFLELIAVVLTINNNNFHRSKFINTTNTLTGGLLEKVNSISEYTNLDAVNQELILENKKLKNDLAKLYTMLDTVSIRQVEDSSKYNQKFYYIEGKIITNNFQKTNNFLTINRGSEDGISTEMAVINSKGILGITENVGPHYTRVQSILNKNSKINASFKNSNHYGTLEWNSKDYNVVQLSDIPRQAEYKIGDTIITGGKSAIFPEGIPIGTVKNIPTKLSALNTIDVILFNDMSNLSQTYIIKSFDRKEILNLNSQSE